MQSEAKQLRLLTRHFFRQFFFLELGDTDETVNASMPRLIGLAATPGFFLTLFEMSRYAWLELKPYAVEEQASLFSKFFLVTLTVAGVGLATLLQWESLFPERRDYVVLGSLPMRLRTIFSARAAALVLFVASFAGAINALSTVVYPFIALRKEDGDLFYFRLLGTHLLCMAAAAVFTFFAIAAVQGVLTNLLRGRLLRRATVAAQFVLMLALLGLFFLAFDAAPLLTTLKAEQSRFLFWCPTVWFVGLYEQLLGHGDAVFAQLARMAAWGTAGAFLLGALTYLLSFRRQATELAEPQAEVSRAGVLSGLFRGFCEAFIVRSQRQRASFFFVLQTLARSRRHWLVLAVYVGAGAAFVIEGGFQYMMETHRGNDHLALMLLSFPLVLSFFALAGLRYIYAVPIQIKANWIFQLCGTEETSMLLSGTRRATAVLVLAPIYGVSTLVIGWRLGWEQALLALGFGVLLTTILCELALLRFDKLPFTCTHLPGQRNVILVAVVGWLIFTLYAYLMANLEYWLSLSLPRMLVFYVVGAALLWKVRQYRRRQGTAESFVFVEQLEPPVQQLGISAG